MMLLIIPLGQLTLGGISEKYLPPDNPCAWRRRTSTGRSPASAPSR